MTTRLDHLGAIAFWVLASIAWSGGSPTEAAEPVSFSREVRPILAGKCYACHGPDEAQSGLALHDRHTVVAEAASGEQAVVPGEPDESELIRRITSDDEYMRMPPEGKPLTSEEVDVLRRWVAEGAEYESHWAFAPPVHRDPPPVQDTSWVRNPIDAFILARLEKRGLQPASPASKRVLARRVYYDLTGLPPTADELADFLADDRPDAYERLVDRLLASPRYGEKWARYWLDLVRYAESNSFERDAPKPYVWKYRDYVIRSLNEDKPYDQFVREQLAGDELDQVTTESITATGYYRLGTWDDEPADALQARYDDLDNIVSTTGQAFLGLTIGCARCHDHKIDPMPQTDYYSFLAFFADVTPYGSRGRSPEENSLWDRSPPDIAQQRKELRAEQKRLQTQLKEIEQSAIVQMSDEDQRRTETRERRKVLREKLHLYLDDGQMQKYRELQDERRAVARELKSLPEPEFVLSLARCDAQPEPTHVMMRGNPHVPGDEVQPRFPELFGDPPPEIPPAEEDAHSAGRRRVLADWIADADNPLTARVMANRVWQHHFGRGIVRSSSNFGHMGIPPTHPELLDWLALYLVEHEWRLKPLHRLILTSNAYRMSSTSVPANLAADPANDLFWRFDMRRLTAEEIRDSVLYVSDRLNLERYGPSIYPEVSEEVLATQSRPGENWHTSSPRDAARRSIYIHIKRSLVIPELALFDFPETDTSCEARFNTIQAAQALNLLHGDFMQKQAAHLANRVQSEAGDDLDTQVEHTLRLVLQRDVEQRTLADCLALVDRYRSEHGLDHQEALEEFCLTVLNLNEFVFLD